MIAYKRDKPSDQSRNEFLRIFSKFMTDCLEDTCPSSWKHCQPSFWEELIFTFFPHSMRISADEKQTETFLDELLKFVRWLDKQVGTAWYPIVENYALIALHELKACEHLLNSLFLINYPRIHHDDWNYEQDNQRILQQLKELVRKRDDLFEVTSIDKDSVNLTKFNSDQTYSIQGLPVELISPGMMMSGMIGKRRDTQHWNWYITEGIYPQRGKKFITLMPKNVSVLKSIGLIDPATSLH